MPDFLCNICGAASAVSAETDFDREKPSCPCGSNVRHRWIVHQISTKLFGRSLSLQQFPVAKEFRGIGFSDNPLYADVLAAAVDFVNTRYDAEPFFDITDPSCGETESLDFIIASEVFEHISPPVQPAFDNLFRLLKPNGFVAFSTPWAPEGDTREHFPNLYDWTIAKLKHEFILINRTRDGLLETFDQLCFHGGPGQTLEMRLFSRPALERHFRAAGFRSVDFATAPVQEFGIIFPHPWSLPCVLTKGACNVFGRI